jgi:hypothetical protein
MLLSYREVISVNMLLKKLDRYYMNTWKISTQQNQAILFFTPRLHCSDPGSGVCSQGSWAIVAWILLLLARLALISLWCIG